MIPFLDRWFPDFPTYLRAEPELFTVVGVLDPAWNEILPTSYVLNRDGSVATRIQGGKSRDEFAAAIEPLLRAP